MYKIGVMGDHDSIYGFAALGFDVFPVSGEEAKKKLKELAESDYAVIYITEKLASELHEQLDKYREELMPAIIRIPGVSGNTGEGIRDIHLSVEKAVGSDILFGNKE
ncbi:MAG: V-type ATP synthase subunit F [Eubacterium sp.]|nr:V-type ATP synthase subunit F [Eubacterium sp.]